MLRSFCCLLTIVALAFAPAALRADNPAKPKAQHNKVAAEKKVDGQKKKVEGEKKEKKPNAERAAKAKKPKVAMGVVKSIDANAKTVTITRTNKKDNTSEVKTFDIADNAEVKIHGEAKALADLVAGKKARLTLSENGKSVVAIEIGAAKKPKQEKKPKPEKKPAA